MLFYTVGQSRVFLVMMYAGVGIGVWYTLMDILRRLTEAGILLSLTLDVMFGAGAAGLVILGALKASRGELRLYALLGALCGFVILRGAAVPALRCAAGLARKARSRFAAREHPLLRRLFR